MNRSFLSVLVDPVRLQPLHLATIDDEQDEVVAGNLHTTDGKVYPIVNGIPRFAGQWDDGQRKTTQAFGFLWKERDTFSSEAARASYSNWLVENYGFKSEFERMEYFSSRERILDLGCGRGYASTWLTMPGWKGRGWWVGIDISEAVEVARENLRHVPNTHFVQGDALSLPFPDGCFDTIISQGVLHHTPSTRIALLSGSRVLAAGGEFHFYVYRRKGPVREFTDDYVRDQIEALSDEDAWNIMRSLTRLGQVLSETNSMVNIEEDIPLLGIKAGEQTIQRLIYWNFAKLYWNPVLSFEENVHVNFDWYRPRYAHRQTGDEVRSWCAEAGLSIEWFHEQESGFSVRARKE